MSTGGPTTRRFEPPWPDAGAGHRHLRDWERIEFGDDWWNVDLQKWVPVVDSIGMHAAMSRGFVRRQCEWAKGHMHVTGPTGPTGGPGPCWVEIPYTNQPFPKPTPMKTLEEMKARAAQQEERLQQLIDEAVASYTKKWVELLEEELEAAYAGTALVREVSVSANRFDAPSTEVDRSVVEDKAADRVTHHFLNRGFNAWKNLVGSAPHQRVTVIW